MIGIGTASATAPGTPRWPRGAKMALLVVLSAGIVGCGALQPGPTGPLTLRDAHDAERRLPTDFDTRLYGFDTPDSVTVVLIAGPLEEPKRAMTIRLFAEPSPGRTPLVRHATNAVVRYARFETAPDGTRHASVYSGAGFLWPGTRPGRPRMHAAMREATLRLIDVSPDFASATEEDDAIEAVTLRGRFGAQRDDVATRRAVRQLEIAISEALSYPRFVEAAPKSVRTATRRLAHDARDGLEGG